MGPRPAGQHEAQPAGRVLHEQLQGLARDRVGPAGGPGRPGAPPACGPSASPSAATGPEAPSAQSSPREAISNDASTCSQKRSGSLSSSSRLSHAVRDEPSPTAHSVRGRSCRTLRGDDGRERTGRVVELRTSLERGMWSSGSASGASLVSTIGAATVETPSGTSRPLICRDHPERLSTRHACRASVDHRPPASSSPGGVRRTTPLSNAAMTACSRLREPLFV